MKKLLLVLLLGTIVLAGCSKKTIIKDDIQPIVNTGEVLEVQNPDGIMVCAKFTDDFIERYQYEDSKGYNFAINIDGYYYNVFRNENNGVSNSLKHGLTGATAAYLFNDWYCWNILFGEIKVAKKDGYGFEYYNLEYKDGYDIKMSSVKEGVETHIIHWEYLY